MDERSDAATTPNGQVRLDDRDSRKAETVFGSVALRWLAAKEEGAEYTYEGEERDLLELHRARHLPGPDLHQHRPYVVLNVLEVALRRLGFEADLRQGWRQLALE